MRTFPQICVIVQGWPKVSTTFVAQELVGLEQEGIDLLLATYGPKDQIKHGIHEQVRAPIMDLGESFVHPIRLFRAWRKVRRWPGYATAKAMLAEDLAHRYSRNRIRAFRRAIVLAAELPDRISAIYAHFLNSATNLARYASAMLEIPLAGSAHAQDIWTAPEWDKRAKLAQMRWCTTCTSDGAEHLQQLADKPGKVHLIHHGLMLARFPTDLPSREARDGGDSSDPVRILSVGRAVEKKGFDLLLEAFSRLPDELHWRWDHIGEGKVLGSLKEQARTLGVDERIQWHGSQEQQRVIAAYRECDIFVLPSLEAGDGDRDGLPNVLMEAQTQGLPCLSTSFSAIPELIVDGETGVLVPPGDVTALTSALTELIRCPGRRNRLGAAGYERVRASFQAETGIRRIAKLLEDLARDPIASTSSATPQQDAARELIGD